MNTYLYAQANPLRYIDPLGLWYFDINSTGGSGTWGGTAGLQIGPAGVYWYAGAGTGLGAGGSVTYNTGDPSTGWSNNLTVSGGDGTLGGQLTDSTDTNGGVTLSGGGGWGLGWGTADAITYTHPIWQSSCH